MFSPSKGEIHHGHGFRAMWNSLMTYLLLVLIFVTLMAAPTKSQQIAQGPDFACYITDDPSWANLYPIPPAASDLQASVECTGFGSLTALSILANVPQLVGPFSQIIAGYTQSVFTIACGILRNGSLICFGDSSDDKTTVPASLNGVRVTQVSGGFSHTIALVNSRAISFGSNSFGEGDLPTDVNFTQVSAGQFLSCGVLANNGSIICAGSDDSGQLSYIPPPDPLDPFIQISLGIDGSYVCALKQSGKLLAWGSADQLPDLRTIVYPDGFCATAVSTAPSQSTPCAIQCGTGNVMCVTSIGEWGVQVSFDGNEISQIASSLFLSTQGMIRGDMVFPRRGSVLQIAAGGVLFSDGSIRTAWATSRNKPPDINVTFIASDALGWGTCSLTSTSSIYCVEEARNLTGSAYSLQDQFVTISLSSTPMPGYYHYFILSAITTTGQLQFFGQNASALIQVTNDFAPPLLKQVITSFNGACGWVTSDSSIICWGYLTGANSSIPLPTRPFGLTAFSSVVGAFNHTRGMQICGIRASNSSVTCVIVDNVSWRYTAFYVSPLQQFRAISFIDQLFCGLLLMDSTIFCNPGQANTPPGRFAQISVTAPMGGDSIVCGVRDDKSVLCSAPMSLPFVPSFARPIVSSSATPQIPNYQYGRCPYGTLSKGEGYLTSLCGGQCTPADENPACILGCPASFVCTLAGVIPCPAGSYCPGDTYGTPPLCPAGRYGITQGLSDSSCTGICPASYYCKAGTADYLASPCPLGHYCHSNATVTPLPCDAGYDGSVTGSSSSQCNGACPPGYLCSAGTTSLQNAMCPATAYCPYNATLAAITCPKAHYCAIGTAQPTPCPAGTYGLSEGLSNSNCTAMCPQGFLCNVATVSFTTQPCPAGLACSFEGTTSAQVVQCEGGYYCPLQSISPRQIPCGSRSVYCPAGSGGPTPISTGFFGVYSSSGSSLTQYNQSQCDLGHYCDGSGVMKPCVAGQYSGAVGAELCSSCILGKYASSSATACDDCEPGRYSSYPNQPCALCGAGSYSESQAAFCTPCDAGTASDIVGRNSSCPACASGKYAASRGSISCVTCPLPYYTPNSQLCASCDNVVTDDGANCLSSNCPANTELSDKHTCVSCPLTTASVAGGKCIQCARAFYTPSVGSGCVSCDDSRMTGLVCESGLARVKEGYWAFRVNDSGLSVFHTVACPDGYCRGGSLQLAPVVNSTTGSTDASSSDSGGSSIAEQFLEASQCEFPRAQSADNYLCGSCAVGYELWNGRCVTCTKSNGGLLFLALLLSVALVCFFIRSASLAASTIARSSTNAALSIVVLYFIQTAAIEIGPVSKYLAWFQISNFGLESTSGGGSGSSGGCIARLNSLQQLVFAMIVPFIFILEISVVATIHFLVWKSGICATHAEQQQQQRDEDSVEVEKPIPFSTRIRHFFGHFSINLYIGSIIAALLFCYTGVASASLAFFSCTDVGNSTKVLFQYPSIRCDSSEYRQGLGLAIFMLVVFIAGFPVATTAFLWKKWTHVQAAHRAKSQNKEAEETVSVETLTFMGRFGMLFNVYHELAWFWQGVILLRRSLFVAVAASLASRPTYKFLAFNYLNFASLALQLYIKPFQSNWLNKVEAASNGLLVLISALLQTGPPFVVEVQVLLLLLLVIPLFTLLVVFVRRNWGHVRKAINTRLDKRRARGESEQPASNGHDFGEHEIAAPSPMSPSRLSNANGVELVMMNGVVTTNEDEIVNTTTPSILLAEDGAISAADAPIMSQHSITSDSSAQL